MNFEHTFVIDNTNGNQLIHIDGFMLDYKKDIILINNSLYRILDTIIELNSLAGGVSLCKTFFVEKIKKDQVDSRIKSRIWK